MKKFKTYFEIRAREIANWDKTKNDINAYSPPKRIGDVTLFHYLQLGDKFVALADRRPITYQKTNEYSWMAKDYPYNAKFINPEEPTKIRPSELVKLIELRPPNWDDKKQNYEYGRTIEDPSKKTNSFWMDVTKIFKPK